MEIIFEINNQKYILIEHTVHGTSISDNLKELIVSNNVIVVSTALEYHGMRYGHYITIKMLIPEYKISAIQSKIFDL